MLSDFLKLIFPNTCHGCETMLHGNANLLCPTCMARLPRTDSHLEYNYDISKRLMGRLPCKYTLAYLYFKKQGVVQQLMHDFKYKEQIQIGEILGTWYGHELKTYKLNTQFDVVLPIPLHPSKLKKRGFNQSTIFGKALAEEMNLIFDDQVLIRNTATTTQTNKSRFLRWSNVAEVFDITDPTLLENKNILLVDDIFTTGATFEAAGQKVLQANAKTISVASLAVAT